MADEQKDASKGPMVQQEGEQLDLKGAIFLVLDGYARLIPNLTTYSNLFDSGVPQTTVDKLTEGTPFNDDTVLVSAVNHAGIYLLDLHKLRAITSPKAMARYSFGGDKVKKVPIGVINSIPRGENINQ
eukprot:UN01552